MKNRVFLGLLHFPVYNKRMETITTSVTNLDIHDIARCVATYNLEGYYLVHPLPTQAALVQEILDYWQKGYGAAYNPDRKQALDVVRIMDSLERVQEDIKEKYGSKLATVVTDARVYSNSVSYKVFRDALEQGEDQNYLLLFGTGWGIIKEVMEQADYVLEPIYGRADYNHLSVRSAVAIILDRIMGEKWWEKVVVPSDI